MFRRIAVLVLLVLVLGSAARADHLAAPEGAPVLTVTGAIADGNATVDGAPAVVLDRAMLVGLPQHEVTRTTDFLEGTNTWSGPLASDVLALAGVTGETATATALDDYVSEIPVALMVEQGAILAIDLNGEPLPEEFGPIWIAWPEGAGDAEVIDHYWVWSLATLDVR